MFNLRNIADCRRIIVVVQEVADGAVRRLLGASDNFFMVRPFIGTEPTRGFCGSDLGMITSISKNIAVQSQQLRACRNG